MESVADLSACAEKASLFKVLFTEQELHNKKAALC